eukprot:1161079-Pelagomonas_calceolata.AAC.17
MGTQTQLDMTLHTLSTEQGSQHPSSKPAWARRHSLRKHFLLIPNFQARPQSKAHEDHLTCRTHPGKSLQPILAAQATRGLMPALIVQHL